MLYGGYEYLQQIFRAGGLAARNTQTRAQKRPGQDARPIEDHFGLKGTHIYVVRRDIRLQETRIQLHIPLELVHDALR